MAYGTLGINVGIVGRWIRFGYAFLILVPMILGAIQSFNPSAQVFMFTLFVLLNFAGITAVYLAAYYYLGKFFSKNHGILNTAILVGPVFVIAFWNPFFSRFTGFLVPSAFLTALTLYFGISLLVQWKLKYGGCEVVSFPILFFKKRYKTYCIPLVVVDAAEKVVVDKVFKK